MASGQSIVVNYLGQTWDPKDGKPNVFDNSYDRKPPLDFPIGKRRSSPAATTLVDEQQPGGRRSAGGGRRPDASSAAKNTLLFVVDVLGSYDAAATASGSPAGTMPAGSRR